MRSDAIDELAGLMADRLESESNAIVERWIDWLQSEIQTRAVKALPRAAIRNHIPPVLRSVAAFLRTPVEAARSSMLGHLELHATLRRGQGYDLDELLIEFDALAHMVSDDLRSQLEEHASAYGPADVIAAYDRVATGMRAIGFVTVEVFRESEVDQRRHLSGRLEEFARTIAHELRSPIHTAALGVQLLRDRAEHDDELRYLELIEQSLRRTSDLLDNLRQLAMVEAGRTRKGQFARVQRLLQECLEQLGPIARERDVRIRSEGAIPDVAVDHMAFQLALVNVFSNAVKYADPAKGERTVVVSMRVQPVADDLDHLVVTVRDNGLGIPPEYVRRVFQRHVRVHPGAAEGTGLGLAITRHLVLERGGDIDLESEQGEGTTVTFELPCHPGAVTLNADVNHRDETVAHAVIGVEEGARDTEAQNATAPNESKGGEAS